MPKIDPSSYFTRMWDARDQITSGVLANGVTAVVDQIYDLG